MSIFVNTCVEECPSSVIYPLDYDLFELDW